MEKDLFQSKLRLRHLHCFMAVAQTRSLRKAADKLHLSQPAMSKTLSELEEIVGVRLLERNRQGAQLTRDGEVFLPHAVAVLEALHAGQHAVGNAQASAGETVHVGALPTVAPDLLPFALTAFRERHADARVVIQTAANAPLLRMLAAGELDFVVGRMADPQMMVGLSFELLYVEPLVMAVRSRHPLVADAAPSLSDILRYPFVVSPKGTIPRHNAESYLQSRGLGIPANCTETLSVSVALQIVRHSDAVWFTPAGAVREHVLDRSLVQLAVPTKGTEEPVGLLLRSEGSLAAPAREFIRVLREAAVGRRAHRPRKSARY
jgi:LysR family transcriptional regulator, pca operon transcriptional activator